MVKILGKVLPGFFLFLPALCRLFCSMGERNSSCLKCFSDSHRHPGLALLIGIFFKKMLWFCFAMGQGVGL